MTTHRTPTQIRRRRYLAVALLAFFLTLLIGSAALANDITTTDPEVSVDTPSSHVGDWLNDATLPQLWNLFAAGAATGITAFAIRWWPWRWPTSIEKEHDIKTGLAFGASVAVAIVGVILTDTYSGLGAFAMQVLYVAITAWLMRDKIPGTRQVARGIAYGG